MKQLSALCYIGLTVMLGLQAATLSHSPFLRGAAFFGVMLVGIVIFDVLAMLLDTEGLD